MRKLRNAATRIRRRAIRKCWREKAEDHKINPSRFYKAFTPFIRNKGKGNIAISLQVDGMIEHDQQKVAEVFGNYFSNITDNIGNIPDLGNHNNMNHNSAKNIQQK